MCHCHQWLSAGCMCWFGGAGSWFKMMQCGPFLRALLIPPHFSAIPLANYALACP